MDGWGGMGENRKVEKRSMDGKLLRRNREVKAGGLWLKWQIKVVRLHLGARAEG